jgi:hypothetical protein
MRFTLIAAISILVSVPAYAAENPAPAPTAKEFAQQLIARCASSGVTDKSACHQSGVQQRVREGGAAAALDMVVELARLDAGVAYATHMYVHWVGWEAFAHYGDPSTAFLNCKDTFGSGCYHGVLQKHLQKVGNVTEQDVRDVCYKTIDTKSSVFLTYQCLHGVGHGLMLHFNRDIEVSLKFCDALLTDWDRESCYGGVFMENYISLHGHDGHGRHDHGHAGHADHTKKPRVTGLRADDLHYPCSAIDEKYLNSCYFLQTSAMFTLIGQDYLRVFKECDRAPKKFIPVCYRSLGRDISGYTVNDAKRVSELCLLGSDEYVGSCYIGAVQDFVNNTAAPDTGIQLCAMLSNDYKRDCYTGLGEMLLSLIPDVAQREAACDRIDARFAPFCKVAARLYQ